jgi:hypothetical protein
VVTIKPLLGSASVFSMLSAAASSIRLSDGDQVWLWVERGSAVITILGLVALFLQLRQMTRRPKLRLGFQIDPGGTGRRLMEIVDTIELPVHWNPGDDLSQPIKLWVLVVNDIKASGTASDINAEARYPKWLVPDGIGDLKEPPGINVWQLFKEGVSLNPGLTFWLRGTFRVPRGRTQVQILVVASMRDAGPIDKVLTVSLKET